MCDGSGEFSNEFVCGEDVGGIFNWHVWEFAGCFESTASSAAYASQREAFHLGEFDLEHTLQRDLRSHWIGSVEGVNGQDFTVSFAKQIEELLSAISRNCLAVDL